MGTGMSDVIWAQRYRPRRVEDIILPARIKSELLGYIEQGTIPNMIFAGEAGVGKTTAALAMTSQLDYDTLVLNGSGADRGIDTVKQKVTGFATTHSIDGGRKCILFDEADNITHDAQLALRGTIEAVSKNCSFVLTCNYPNRLLDALRSRCPVVTFSVGKDEADELMGLMFKRCLAILDENEVEYDKASVARIVKKYFPDFRRTIGALQRASASGRVDATAVKDAGGDDMRSLVSAVKAKDLGAINLWVAESPVEPTDVMAWFSQDSRRADTFADDPGYANAVVLAYEHMRDDAFVADRDTNLRAFLFKLVKLGYR